MSSRLTSVTVFFMLLFVQHYRALSASFSSFFLLKEMLHQWQQLDCVIGKHREKNVLLKVYYSVWTCCDGCGSHHLVVWMCYFRCDSFQPEWLSSLFLSAADWLFSVWEHKRDVERFVSSAGWTPADTRAAGWLTAMDVIQRVSMKWGYCTFSA